MWLVGPVLAFPLSMPRGCWMWGRGVWRRTPVGWLLSHGHCSSHRGTWAGRGKTSTTHLELGNERPHSYRPHEEGPSSARGLGITGGACSSGWVEFRSSRAPSIQSLSVATVRGGGSGPVSGPGGGRREQAHLLLGLWGLSGSVPLMGSQIMALGRLPLCVVTWDLAPLDVGHGEARQLPAGLAWMPEKQLRVKIRRHLSSLLVSWRGGEETRDQEDVAFHRGGHSRRQLGAWFSGAAALGQASRRTRCPWRGEAESRAL